MSGPPVAPPWLRELGRRFWRRTGVRLAVVQVLVVPIAFGVAGVMTRADIHASNEATLRREILGEAASLQDEIVRRGESRLAATVDRRTRLWRGFDYGLQAADHTQQAGLLRPPQAHGGWMELTQRDAAGAPQTYLAYAERTPSGGWLTVGKNLAAGRRELQLVTWRLVAAATWGGLICLVVWALSVRSTWRRLEGIADTARLVADGRLNLRAPVRPARRPDDIDELGFAFNAMLDRIGGLVGELRRVTTDVAHDLRTPLTRMRQKLEELEAAPDLPPQRRLVVAQTQADLRELLRTFNSILQLAEIEGRSLADEGHVFDLAEVAQRLADTFRPDLEESGRVLEVSAAHAEVAGDPSLVAQLLANLIENAMRHTPCGATVRITVDAAADGPRLTVADDGPGVPAHLRQAVLAPFFRLDASRSSPGSGVGLAIVAAVAARHRAKLALEDNGPGLRVIAVFPPPPASRPRPLASAA
jgi:signal transduction histidine kinase